MTKRDGNQSWRTIGASSAIYLALAYSAGITIFLVALRYNEIKDLEGRLAVVVENPSLIFATNLLMYVFFGPVLVGLALAIRNEARANGSRALADLVAAIGVIWAATLVACGMVANAAIAPVVELFSSDRAEAETYWRVIETVTTGLGNGNGEIPGSLFTLLASLAILRHALFTRLVAFIGLVACVPGFLSVLPPLHDLSGLFGILQLVWFIALAVSFTKIRNRPLPEART